MALRATKDDEDAPSWGGRPRPRTGALAGPTAAGRRARGASSTERAVASFRSPSCETLVTSCRFPKPASGGEGGPGKAPARRIAGWSYATLFFIDPGRVLEAGLSVEAVCAMYRFHGFQGFIQAYKSVVERLRAPQDYAHHAGLNPAYQGLNLSPAEAPSASASS